MDGTTQLAPRSLGRALLGWGVVVPVLAGLSAWLIAVSGANLLVTLVLVVVLLGVSRVLLGSFDRGLLWRILTAACALGVSLPVLLGGQAYVAVFGERVTAVVSEESSVLSRRLADPDTGADLGELSGTRSITGAGEVGEPIDVLVAPGVDPQPVVRARELGSTALTVWLVSWAAGLVLVLAFGLRGRGRGPAA